MPVYEIFEFCWKVKNILMINSDQEESTHDQAHLFARMKQTKDVQKDVSMKFIEIFSIQIEVVNKLTDKVNKGTSILPQTTPISSSASVFNVISKPHHLSKVFFAFYWIRFFGQDELDPFRQCLQHGSNSNKWNSFTIVQSFVVVVGSEKRINFKVRVKSLLRIA